jgi:FtsP/CotA-like multicopper oxidase with cupredoxin domain
MTRKVAVLACVAWAASAIAVHAQDPHRHDAAAAMAPVTAASPTVVAGPPVLENVSPAPRTVEVVLTASPARLSLRPGTSTDAYAYNGRVPGPTLEVREGDTVIVHFRNELPEPTTVHWHGLHIPFVADGSPFHLVAPGAQYDYVFTLKPGSAGTYWYHPHPHHRTGYQVGKGLYGAVIVRAADDPLPSGLREQLLVLSDNRFLSDGSIDLPDPDSPEGRIDFENGRQGDVLFVNGAVMPVIGIRSGEVQRWRVVNASAARVYRLSLTGHVFRHVGSDGGLFERPLDVNEILLANGERVELLVRGTGAPGTQSQLQTLPYDRFVPQTRPKDWSVPRDLLTLQYTDEDPLPPVTLPELLRPVTPLDETVATATRVMVLTQGFINGRMMDMDRVDVTAPLGATEVWLIQNLVGMDHPFHLHGFQFQVIERNGVPEPYRSWKDTVNVPRHQTARFIVRYDNYPGKWMFHCHILDHEDHGMMGVLEVK